MLIQAYHQIVTYMALARRPSFKWHTPSKYVYILVQATFSTIHSAAVRYCSGSLVIGLQLLPFSFRDCGLYTYTHMPLTFTQVVVYIAKKYANFCTEAKYREPHFYLFYIYILFFFWKKLFLSNCRVNEYEHEKCARALT